MNTSVSDGLDSLGCVDDEIVILRTEKNNQFAQKEADLENKRQKAINEILGGFTKLQVDLNKRDLDTYYNGSWERRYAYSQVLINLPMDEADEINKLIQAGMFDDVYVYTLNHDRLVVGRYDGRIYELARCGYNQLPYEKIEEVIDESWDVYKRWFRWTNIFEEEWSVGKAVLILLSIAIFSSFAIGWKAVIGMIAVFIGSGYLICTNSPENRRKMYLDKYRFPKVIIT